MNAFENLCKELYVYGKYYLLCQKLFIELNLYKAWTNYDQRLSNHCIVSQVSNVDNIQQAIRN